MSTISEGAPMMHLSQLEAIRHQMVRTVLEVRTLCEDAGESHPSGTTTVWAESAQRRLSATVKSLVELDDRLHKLRTANAECLTAPPFEDVQGLLAGSR